MIAFLASLWRRRWCHLLGIGLMLCALFLMNPLIRQSIFGPQIGDVPWCVWEEQIRNNAMPNRPKSTVQQVLEKLGLYPTLNYNRLRADPDLLPIYLELAEDGAPEVRQFALQILDRSLHGEKSWRWSKDQESKILTAMQRRLNDDAPACRLMAAKYLWRTSGDRRMIDVPLAYLDHPDPAVRHAAGLAVCHLAEADVDKAFEPILKLAEDPKSRMELRATALNALQHFGKRGLPVLANALKDPSQILRLTAIRTCQEMAGDAKDLIPILVQLRHHQDPDTRLWSARALGAIDPARFRGPGK